MLVRGADFSAGTMPPSPRPAPLGEGELLELAGETYVDRIRKAWLALPSPWGEGQGEGNSVPEC
jgi:hypothetical protein